MTVTETAPATVQVQVGDFFVSSWGYDQTNVDFYKVVGMTPSGKSVWLQKWSSSCVSDNGPQVYVVPGEKPATYMDWSAVPEGADYFTREQLKVRRDAPVELKRLNTRWGGSRVTLTSYSSASRWDGRPKYETGRGWGH